MITSQILKLVDFTKIQKSRYLENETLFFLQIKKFINYTTRTTLWQKNRFVVEVTFKHKKTSKNKMLAKFYRTLPKDVRLPLQKIFWSSDRRLPWISFFVVFFLLLKTFHDKSRNPYKLFSNLPKWKDV